VDRPDVDGWSACVDFDDRRIQVKGVAVLAQTDAGKTCTRNRAGRATAIFDDRADLSADERRVVVTEKRSGHGTAERDDAGLVDDDDPFTAGIVEQLRAARPVSLFDDPLQTLRPHALD